MTVDEQIDEDVKHYLECCEKIAAHQDEAQQRRNANVLFRHIEQLKEDKKRRSA